MVYPKLFGISRYVVYLPIFFANDALFLYETAKKDDAFYGDGFL